MFNDTTKISEILTNSNNLDEFIKTLIKDMVESLLKAELSEFLKYDKYEYKGRNSGNSRNGYFLEITTLNTVKSKKFKFPGIVMENFNKSLLSLINDVTVG